LAAFIVTCSLRTRVKNVRSQSCKLMVKNTLSSETVVPLCSQSAWSALKKHGSASSISLKNTPAKKAPYERLLTDAMSGDGAHLTREDVVEADWAVVDPVLKHHHRLRPYKRGSWGPKEAGSMLGPNDSWHNPAVTA
jgi:glucose-6-phosphate 1-dehydrogenase